MGNIRKARIKDASKLMRLIGASTVSEATGIMRERDFYVNSDYSLAASGISLSPFSLKVSFFGNVTETFINELLYFLFFEKNLYKVSVVVPVNNRKLEDKLISCGFDQEAVLHGEIYDDGFFVDAGLFYITMPAFQGYSVGFVPFGRGVVAVCGSNDYVDSVRFLGYGKEIDDNLIRLCADYNGLVKDGKLCARGDSSFEEYSPEGLPLEVLRAVGEIREYMAKERTSFDITVKLPEASKFRLEVWEKIKTIPYGDTRSYEDIALELTGNDFKEARKLTRAVGHACSMNPVPVLVPCHRVIGKDGKLVGFRDGVEFKDFLLTHELFSAMPLN